MIFKEIQEFLGKYDYLIVACHFFSNFFRKKSNKSLNEMELEKIDSIKNINTIHHIH
jgi:hypothetical protein